MEEDPPSSHGGEQPLFQGLVLHGLKTADYLKAEPKLTTAQKAALAGHLAREIPPAGGGDDAGESEAILRLMVWNGELPVLEAMARSAAGNPNTSRNLAWALANDDEAVALPVLELVRSLSDSDLLCIVQTSGNFSKMNAIACRPEVSAEVSRSLVHHGDETTARSLLGNTKADIPEDAYSFALDRFSQSENIQEAIIDRSPISASIAQRLIDSVTSERLAGKLSARRHAALSGAPPGFAIERTEEEWDRRMAQLQAEKSKESLLVRFLCNGDFDFFTRGLAALTGSPAEEVREGLLDSASGYLAPAWAKAKLPPNWLPLAAAALSALIEIDRTASKADRQIFERNVLDRTLATLNKAKITLTETQRRVFVRPRF